MGYYRFGMLDDMVLSFGRLSVTIAMSSSFTSFVCNQIMFLYWSKNAVSCVGDKSFDLFIIFIQLHITLRWGLAMGWISEQAGCSAGIAFWNQCSWNIKFFSLNLKNWIKDISDGIIFLVRPLILISLWKRVLQQWNDMIILKLNDWKLLVSPSFIEEILGNREVVDRYLWFTNWPIPSLMSSVISNDKQGRRDFLVCLN